MKRLRANDNEINDKIEAAVTVARNLGTDPEADFQRLNRVKRPSRRLDDNATPVLGNLKSFYRCEFFKFIDSLISTLREKYQSLASVLQPFLKVIDSKAPGNIDDITTLVATLPSVFPSSISATLYNEFKVFFQYLDEQRSLEEFDEGGEQHSQKQRMSLSS